MSLNGIFDGAKPYEPSSSWIGPGTHELRVLSFGFKKEFEIKFLVEKSDHHAVGSEVKAKYNPYKSGWQGEQDRDRAFAFVMQLFGIEDTTQVERYAEAINTPDNVAMGMMIKAVGVQGKAPTNPDGTPQLDKHGKPKKGWTDVTFYNLPNTQEAIAAGRQRCIAYSNGDLKFEAPVAVAQAAAQPAPVAAPVAVAQPAPAPAAAPVATLPGLPGIPNGQ